MLLSGDIPEISDRGQELKLKGKAVAIEHFLFDELWNSGDRIMPDGVTFQKEELKEKDEEDGQILTETEERKASEMIDEKEEELKEPEQEMPAEEVDLRLLEAVKRTLIEQCNEMPLEPSDFQKMLSEYTMSDGQKIDLRKSSFKKIGKLLEAISDSKGNGLIRYAEVKQGGHKLIQRVNDDWQADFVPQFKLKRTKQAK